MKICNNCGSNVPEDSNFCPFCGSNNINNSKTIGSVSVDNPNKSSDVKRLLIFLALIVVASFVFVIGKDLKRTGNSEDLITNNFESDIYITYSYRILSISNNDEKNYAERILGSQTKNKDFYVSDYFAKGLRCKITLYLGYKIDDTQMIYADAYSDFGEKSMHVEWGEWLDDYSIDLYIDTLPNTYGYVQITNNWNDETIEIFCTNN